MCALSIISDLRITQKNKNQNKNTKKKAKERIQNKYKSFRGEMRELSAL